MPCHHAIKPHRACAREYASTDVPAVVAEVGCCASRSQESHGKWHAAPAMRAWRVCPRAPWRRALYVTGGSSPRGLGDETLQLRPVPFFLPIAYHRRSPPNHTGSGTRHPRCARGGCARACDAVAPRAVRNWGFVIKGARRQNPPIASLLPNCIPPPHATTPPLHRGRRDAGYRGRPRGDVGTSGPLPDMRGTPRAGNYNAASARWTSELGAIAVDVRETLASCTALLVVAHGALFPCVR